MLRDRGVPHRQLLKNQVGLAHELTYYGLTEALNPSKEYILIAGGWGRIALEGQSATYVEALDSCEIYCPVTNTSQIISLLPSARFTSLIIRDCFVFIYFIISSSI